MTDEQKVEDTETVDLAPEDFTEELEPELDYDKNRQRINLGLHPLGGVILDIVDANGRNATIQLDSQLLGQLVLNLITLNVITAQQEAAMRQAAESLPDLWTPKA